MYFISLSVSDSVPSNDASLPSGYIVPIIFNLFKLDPVTLFLSKVGNDFSKMVLHFSTLGPEEISESANLRRKLGLYS